MLQAGNDADSIPMKSFDFSINRNPSSRTMTLGLTEPLTEMSTRDLPEGKGRPERKADNLIAICDLIVKRKCGSIDVSQP
jgi:hypothetical protein